MHSTRRASAARVHADLARLQPPPPTTPQPMSRDSGVVMSGQLLVFSGCIVFQSNVLGVIKVKTM